VTVTRPTGRADGDLTELLRDIRGVYRTVRVTAFRRIRLGNGRLGAPADASRGEDPRSLEVPVDRRPASPPDGMLYAPFVAGAKLLVANGATLSDIPLVTPGAATTAATIPRPGRTRSSTATG
jgi:hypothetical protein